jgi:hypothetical protein
MRRVRVELKKRFALIIAGLLIGLFGEVSIVRAATYYSVNSGDWNSNTCWSLTSGGVVVPTGVYPGAGDNVVLEGERTVTVLSTVNCAEISFVGGKSQNTTLVFGADGNLVVSGAITIPRAGGTATTYHNTIDVGAGILQAGAIAFTDGGIDNRHQLLISTGVVTVSGDITTANPRASATVSFSDKGTLNIGGAFLTQTVVGTETGGTLIAGMGTVNYTGSAQIIHAFTYNNLTLSGSGIKMLSSSMNSISGNLVLVGAVSVSTAVGLSIGRDFRIGDGVNTAAFTVLNHDLSVGGISDIANGSTFTITSGYGTKTFGGKVIVEVGGTWNNSGNEDVSFQGGLTNWGTFNAGTGLQSFEATPQTVDGNLSIPYLIVNEITLTNQNTLIVTKRLAGTGTFSQAQNAILNLGDEITITNFSASDKENTVDFNGTVSQIVPAFNYYHLKISGAHNTTTVTLAPSGVIGVVGAFLPTATFQSGKKYVITGSTIEFNGGNQNIPSFTYNNLTCSGSGVKTMDTNLALAGNLIVLSGTNLNVSAAVRLSVNGAITNNGVFALKSNAEKGTATLLDNGSVGGSGEYRVEQWLPAGRNWYIASPVASVKGGAASQAGYDLWKYDEGSASWLTVSDEENMLPMNGYVACKPSGEDGLMMFTGGALNTNISSVVLPRTLNEKPKRGFYLAGNPYPSCVDWDSPNAIRKNLFPTIWCRTKSTTLGKYFFETYNQGVGTNASGNGKVSRYIPPMQAFWVFACAPDNELGFPNSVRSHPVSNNLRSGEVVDQKIIRLQVSNGKYSDETIVRYTPMAQNGFDDFDSYKMSNGNDSIPEICTYVGGEKMVINGRPEFQGVDNLQLGFSTGHVNTYTIRMTEFVNFDAGARVWLVDHLLGQVYDLTDSTAYCFSSPAIQSQDRFSLSITTMPEITVEDSPVNIDNLRVYLDPDKRIVLENAKEDYRYGAVVEITNVLGQLIWRDKLTEMKTVPRECLSDGVYCVIIESKKGRFIKKVMIP